MISRLFYCIYKFLWIIKRWLSAKCGKIISVCKFKGNRVVFRTFHTTGSPFIIIARGGKMTIGNNFSMHNSNVGNPIGCYQRCTFFVHTGCNITIGDNVGISQSSLISYCNITIGDNVKIGGGSCVYTTDFHSLDFQIRASSDDIKYRKCAPVVIGDNVFIGACCIILKGVTIGRNSIIGAGSVVTKSVPPNQIWAGNPAKFIRTIE